MKPKKLTLREITEAYKVVEPLLLDGTEIKMLVDKAIDSGKGKSLFYIFYDKKYEYPENIMGQSLLLEVASLENNFVDFIRFMSEISNASKNS